MKTLLSVLLAFGITLYSFYLTVVLWFAGYDLYALFAAIICVGTITVMWNLGKIEALR